MEELGFYGPVRRTEHHRGLDEELEEAGQRRAYRWSCSESPLEDGHRHFIFGDAGGGDGG